MPRLEPFIDTHSHILPGVDHGSDSVETSLELLYQAQKNNIGTIIATPHFYPEEDTVADFVKRREIGYASIMNSAKNVGCNINIIKAAEVQLVPELSKLDGIKRLAIEGSRFILIELPFACWGSWVYDELFAITGRNQLIPIIAHIDRYPLDYIQKILASQYYLQINSDTAQFRASLKKYAEYVKTGKICFLGSDVHDAIDRNYTSFANAMQNLMSIRKSFDTDAKDLLFNSEE